MAKGRTGLSVFTFTFTFRFTAKLNRKYQELPYISCSHTCTTSPLTYFTRVVQFVITDEFVLTYNYHSESIVYTGFHLGVIHSIVVDKYIMAYIHHYTIIQNSFNALKTLCTQFIHPSFPPVLGNH